MAELPNTKPRFEPRILAPTMTKPEVTPNPSAVDNELPRSSPLAKTIQVETTRTIISKPILTSITYRPLERLKLMLNTKAKTSRLMCYSQGNL
jgi:hypothetical protein